MLSAAFSSVSSFLVFRSAEQQAAQSVLFWLLGSVSGAAWQQLWLPTGTVLLAVALLAAAGGWLDAHPATRDLPAVRDERFLALPYAMWTSGPLNIDAAERVRAALEDWGLVPAS